MPLERRGAVKHPCHRMNHDRILADPLLDEGRPVVEPRFGLNPRQADHVEAISESGPRRPRGTGRLGQRAG